MGIIVLIAVIGFGFIGCKEEEGTVTPPDLPKMNASELRNYEGRKIDIYSSWERMVLESILWRLWGDIGGELMGDYGAEAFFIQYGMNEGTVKTSGTYKYDKRMNREYSISVNQNLSNKFRNDILDNYDTYFTGTAAAQITHSYKWNSNLTMESFYDKQNSINAEFVNKDKESYSGKYKDTFEFDPITFEHWDWWGNRNTYKVSGKKLNEGDYSGSWEMVDKNINKEKSSEKGTWKGAIALSVTCLTNLDRNGNSDPFGAKIIWRSANSNNSSQRSVKESNGDQSSLIAYDNDGNILYIYW